MTVLSGAIHTSGGRTIFSNAEGYERHLGRWSSRLAGRLVEFVGVQAGDRVLDVGSGTGALAFSLAGSRSCAEVVGIDLSLSYIRFARARIQDPRFHFHLGDAANLPYARNHFDKSIAQFLLNYVSNGHRVVGEMRRVTKWGGTVAACLWASGTGNERNRNFWEAAMAIDPTAREKRETEKDYGRRGRLTALWTECGLKQVEEDYLSVSLEFGSFEEFWLPYLEGQGHAAAYVKSLSPDQQQSLRSRLYRNIFGAKAEGPFTLRAQVVAVQGIC
jgi:SAM-dependent methyltransferase